MLIGRRIRSNLPVNEDLLTAKGAFRIRRAKEDQKAKRRQLHDQKVKHMPMLKPGDVVRLKDCSTGTWRQTGQVQEEVAPRSYSVQMDSGLSLRRNRTDLQRQQSQEDTVAQEVVQQKTAGSPELAGSGPDSADSGLTKVPASPAVTGLSRPKRHVQPPKEAD